MKTRLGRREDIKEIVGYLKEMWMMHAKMEPEYVSAKKIGAYTPERIKRYLKDCFNGSKKSFLLIAEEDWEMAGFLKVDIVKIQSFFVETRVAYLDDVYVLEKYRGRGVTRELVQEAKRLAKKRGIKWLEARIYEFNKPAQKTFEKLGMRSLYSEWFGKI